MLGHYPATRISVFVFLTPMFALLFGALWLNEAVTVTLVFASIRGGGDCARQSAASALMHAYVWVKFCKPRRAINRSISKRYAGSFFGGKCCTFRQQSFEFGFAEYLL